MPAITPLFASPVYRADAQEGVPASLVNALESACLAIAEDDRAGQRWCEKNGYHGLHLLCLAG